MAARASSPERPTAAWVSSAYTSRPASTDTSRRSWANDATCLYRLGWRTPNRAATAARVSPGQPLSSAISAAAAAMTGRLRPALGIDDAPPDLQGELDHDGIGELGELGLRIVSGVGDHHEPAPHAVGDH